MHDQASLNAFAAMTIDIAVLDDGHYVIGKTTAVPVTGASVWTSEGISVGGMVGTPWEFQ